jgi:hypothetical protein
MANTAARITRATAAGTNQVPGLSFRFWEVLAAGRSLDWQGPRRCREAPDLKA